QMSNMYCSPTRGFPPFPVKVLTFWQKACMIRLVTICNFSFLTVTFRPSRAFFYARTNN
ncbi:hypothetical protein HMPREF0372_02508, partial [Flavonifractor plautii ATCC 29863]